MLTVIEEVNKGVYGKGRCHDDVLRRKTQRGRKWAVREEGEYMMSVVMRWVGELLVCEGVWMVVGVLMV